MNAALHADNRHIADVAEDKTARVARNSGNREAFDIVVIEGCGNADIIRKITEAGTENQCDFRLEIDLGAGSSRSISSVFRKQGLVCCS